MTDITVIIPTRHRAELLKATLFSVLTARAEAERAEPSRIRILVVDDAPTNDETRHLVAGLPGVDYLRLTEHDGRNDPGAAIIAGMAAVDTAFSTIFGDDDMMLPRHFVLAAQKIEDGCDVVSSSFSFVDAKLKFIGDWILKPTAVRDLVEGRTGVNDGAFVRSEFAREVQLDVTLEAHMLVPLWGRLMLDGRRFEVITEPTWLYRRHTTNLSTGALTAADLELRSRVRRLLMDELMSRPEVLRREFGAPTIDS